MLKSRVIVLMHVRVMPCYLAMCLMPWDQLYSTHLLNFFFRRIKSTTAKLTCQQGFSSLHAVISLSYLTKQALNSPEFTFAQYQRSRIQLQFGMNDLYIDIIETDFFHAPYDRAVRCFQRASVSISKFK